MVVLSSEACVGTWVRILEEGYLWAFLQKKNGYTRIQQIDWKITIDSRAIQDPDSGLFTGCQAQIRYFDAHFLEFENEALIIPSESPKMLKDTPKSKSIFSNIGNFFKKKPSSQSPKEATNISAAYRTPSPEPYLGNDPPPKSTKPKWITPEKSKSRRKKASWTQFQSTVTNF